MKHLVRTLFLLLLLVNVACERYEPMKAISEPQTRGEQTNEVTIDEAQAELESLWSQLHASNTRGQIAPTGPIVESRYETEIPYYNEASKKVETTGIYVMNFPNDGGFAIMSSDKRLPSLIACSDKGNLPQDAVLEEPGFVNFLVKARNFIENHSWYLSDLVVIDPNEGGTSTLYYTVYGDWETKLYGGNGLCPVKWGQGEPYNKYSPSILGNKTPAGCVPAALAQFMAVYKYPSTYAGYYFDWNAMTAYPYGIQCTDNAQDKIARLYNQLSLKKNLDVGFGLEGSGARFQDIGRTLKNFGYTNTGSLINYDIDKINADLMKSYPVLASGYSSKKTYKFFNWTINTKYEGGHAWLMHGLMERSRTVKVYSYSNQLISTKIETYYYPLCNWGWDGYRDGYYLSEVFDTTEGPAYGPDKAPELVAERAKDGDFQYKLQAIVGIRK